MSTTTSGLASAAPDHDITPTVRERGWKNAIIFAVLGLIAPLAFGLGSPAGATSTFEVTLPDAVLFIEPIGVPSQTAALALGLLCLALAGFAVFRELRGFRTPRTVAAVFGVAWVLSFLCWAVADKSISMVGLLQGSLLLAVPLVFGALSGVLSERAGVINIAIEGQLLAGAFLSAVVASVSDNVYLGLLAAPVAGLLIGLLLAVFTIRYVVDQIIVGVVLVVFVVGLTSFLYGRLLAPQADVFNTPETFSSIAIPLLSDIPLLGAVLFEQSIIVYLMYGAVALVHVAIFHTRWGLRVRSVGEHPQAADTVGINVYRTRFRQVALGGAMAGLGGAFFTLGQVGAFGEQMTSGKGFIALAAMIFGRHRPLGALGAALLFGFADNLQSYLSIIGTPIPSQFMLMVPYLVTVFAVAGLVGRHRPPAAIGRPYIKS
ncbi:MAG TPA: ABC transporter permease [Nocardioidaceae bacterium]|nr:ABC transporter permease [Nocardioidaceae bacterium]